MDLEISQYKFLLSKLLDERMKITDFDAFEEYVGFCYEHSLPKRIKYKTCLHHILLESVYPEYSNLKECAWNGVFLTHEDHFIAHSLLARCSDNSKAVSAWNLMNICNSNKVNYNSEVLINSKMYGELMEKAIINNAEIARNSKNRNSEKQRLATIKANKERVWSEESKEKLRQKMLGRKISDETKEKQRQKRLGSKRSDETKILMKESSVKYRPAYSLTDENGNFLEKFWNGSLGDLCDEYNIHFRTAETSLRKGEKLYSSVSGKKKAKEKNMEHCIGWEIKRLPFSLVECLDTLGNVIYYKVSKILLDEGEEYSNNPEYFIRKTTHKTLPELIDILKDYDYETDDYTRGWRKFNIKE